VKRALVSVLRLTMLVGVLVLVPIISKGPGAQLVSQCTTFQTSDDDCGLCCSKGGSPLVNDIVTPLTTTGTFSLLDTTVNCGSVVSGCHASPTSCSSVSYPESVSDSNCCVADGATCASNEPCCPGTQCLSSGDCGVCSETGESCGTDSDCCSGSGACISGVCTVSQGGGGGGLPKCPAGPVEPNQDQGCNPSPVIIDVGGSGFQLTNAAGGVRFDISGTGTPIQMGWTAEGAANAFLALPGADGLVDTGKQLFGNFTAQPPSDNPNGFAALAVYDLPVNGGNGDGIIDSRDAIYSVLRLWIDANHDGISQPEELHTLSSLGVVSISLNYTLSRRVDQYGNVFRYKAAVDPNDPDPSHVGRTAYDVFFVTASSSGTQ
jgi:hypothetical protein